MKIYSKIQYSPTKVPFQQRICYSKYLFFKKSFKFLAQPIIFTKNTAKAVKYQNSFLLLFWLLRIESFPFIIKNKRI